MIIIKQIIFLLSGILMVSPLIAQEDLPQKPEILRVTVDTSYTGQGHAVLIEWLPVPENDILFYIIYRVDDQGVGIAVDSVSYNETSYLHIMSDLVNFKYSITAYDTDGNESLLTPGEHRGMIVNVVFDTCYNRNIIQWNHYEGWGGDLAYYRVFIAGDCEPHETIVTGQENSYVQEDVSVNSCYSYRIEAVKNQDNLVSFSNLVRLETNLPDPPEYLYLDYVDVLNDGEVEISFTTDINSPIRDFQLLRSSEVNGNYGIVRSIQDINQSTNVVNDRINASKEQYFYKIDAVYQPEGCPSARKIISSNTGNNILLTGFEQNDVINIYWTSYEEFPDGLQEYIITRSTVGEEPIDVDTFLPGTIHYSENINSFVNRPQPGEIKYQVKAISKFDSLGRLHESHSNWITIPIETRLYMPNAFTPNNDGNNDLFVPVLDFAPKSFLMIIYDRSGKKLFQTTDPYEGWDGSFGGGDRVMEGVYVYFVQYTGFTGISKSLTGNVAVIYP